MAGGASAPSDVSLPRGAHGADLVEDAARTGISVRGVSGGIQDVLPPLSVPQTIFELPESAYGVNLHLQKDATLVLTPGGLYRVPNSGATVTGLWAARPLPLGVTATVRGDEVIYWSHGALQAASTQAGSAKTLLRMAGEPQHIVAGRAGVAWLRQDLQGGYIIEKLDGDGKNAKAKSLYSTPDSLHSLLMMDDSVFSVRSSGPSKYRIVAVPLNGRKAVEGREYTGRTPSMLAGYQDYIYYYDGSVRGVRRVRRDFQEDELVSKGTICSPITVGPRIVCAHVGGLFAIDEATGETRVLVEERRGPVTSVAVSGERVTWVTDLGRSGALSVSWVPLSGV